MDEGPGSDALSEEERRTCNEGDLDSAIRGMQSG